MGKIAVMQRGVLLLLGLATAGCASVDGSRTAASEQGAVARMTEVTPARVDACPLSPLAPRVAVEDVQDGAALIVTTREDILALRERLAALTPATLGGAGSRTDNVHGGLRVVYEARGAEGVEPVRAAVLEHARSLADACGSSVARNDEPPPKAKPAAVDSKPEPPEPSQSPSAPPKEPEKKPSKADASKPGSEKAAPKPKPSKGDSVKKENGAEKKPPADKPKDDKAPPPEKRPEPPGLKPPALPPPPPPQLPR